MKADRNATLNAPVLTGNTIAGPINISYVMPPIGNDTFEEVLFS